MYLGTFCAFPCTYYPFRINGAVPISLASNQRVGSSNLSGRTIKFQKNNYLFVEVDRLTSSFFRECPCSVRVLNSERVGPHNHAMAIWTKPA